MLNLGWRITGFFVPCPSAGTNTHIFIIIAHISGRRIPPLPVCVSVILSCPPGGLRWTRNEYLFQLASLYIVTRDIGMNMSLSV